MGQILTMPKKRSKSTQCHHLYNFYSTRVYIPNSRQSAHWFWIRSFFQDFKHIWEWQLSWECDLYQIHKRYFPLCRGWSGGAKVLGKLSVPGCPTSLNDGRARAYCACSRCGWGFVWTFFRLSFLFSFSLFGRRPDID